jgi:L-seryl-tRNA(Ser) seleniumtransferase
VNATGIIIHTNLGRSLLSDEAVARLQLICGGYNNLEYDLQRGERGSRYVHAEAILGELTGAEAALVVNNNAGAVFLALSTLARGREVVVSRGQLVEIGGAFRIPDVMSSSGALLREVGTTNRTHLKDYASAITDQTALLMKVHTSNYKIIGFTAEVALEDLVKLGRERGLPVMEDLGSGCFVNLAPFGLHGETTVQETVNTGADLVTFSGDKLLGGPQAGILVGRKDLIEQCRKNPITRALRVDKMSLAALEVTLRLYRDQHQALEKIPTLRMIATPAEKLKSRAEELARMIREIDGSAAMRVEVQQGFSQVGGGSLPAQNLSSHVVAVRSEMYSPNAIEKHLRENDPPIIGRIESDSFIMDVRTVKDTELEFIRRAFSHMLVQE